MRTIRRLKGLSTNDPVSFDFLASQNRASSDEASLVRNANKQISPAMKGGLVGAPCVPRSRDPKLAHLDGLNLSRAWMLEGIAAGLPKGDERLPIVVAAAEAHRRAGLGAMTGYHYEGGHWLGALRFTLSRDGAFPRSESQHYALFGTII
jgi:hypothetical protein